MQGESWVCGPCATTAFVVHPVPAGQADLVKSWILIRESGGRGKGCEVGTVGFELPATPPLCPICVLKPHLGGPWCRPGGVQPRGRGRVNCRAGHPWWATFTFGKAPLPTLARTVVLVGGTTLLRGLPDRVRMHHWPLRSNLCCKLKHCTPSFSSFLRLFWKCSSTIRIHDGPKYGH